MFITCTNCNAKYLVNSADLKPSGRKVQCVNCNYQWFQNIDDIDLSSTTKINTSEDTKKIENKNENNGETIKNLPSTLVHQDKPSTFNSIIVIIAILLLFLVIWISNLYGFNSFVLIYFYINEFLFNLNLIFSDLAKIFHNTLN